MATTEMMKVSFHTSEVGLDNRPIITIEPSGERLNFLVGDNELYFWLKTGASLTWAKHVATYLSQHITHLGHLRLTT
jgi:hypothetical protein